MLLPLYEYYSYLPIWQTPPNVIAGIVFDIINGFIVVGIFIIIKDGIPKEGWKKGAYYGAIMGIFRVVMFTFTIVVLLNVPILIVMLNLIAGFVESLILGIVTEFLSRKFELEFRIEEE